jgi:hypothetical protein
MGGFPQRPRLTSLGPGNNMMAIFAVRQNLLRCDSGLRLPGLALRNAGSSVEFEKWVMKIAGGSGLSSAFFVCGSRL